MSVEQCCALDDNGKKCRRRAVRRHRVFTNHEMYSDLSAEVRLGWVLVPLCDHHERAVL